MATTKIKTELISDGAVTSEKLDTNISVAGDLAVDTNTLFVDSATNNVGIGTSSPSAKFSVLQPTANSEYASMGSGGTVDRHLKFSGFVTNGTNNVGHRLSALNAIALNVSGNDALYIDRDSNVGIGTSTPAYNLTIEDTTDAILQIKGSDLGRLYFGDAASDNVGRVQYYHIDNSMQFYTNSAERMRLESDGDLHLDGDVIAFSTTISDQRLKDDVQTIDNALDKIESLRGVTYTWNKGGRKGQKDIGLIAQEVEKVLPEIVREKQMTLLDGETYKTVDYEKLVGVLIESVKELSAKVKELENKL